MDPVAKADRQSALTFVSLKAVIVVLENRAGENLQAIKRFIVQGMCDGSLRYRHRDSREPPPEFLRSADRFSFNFADSFTFNGNDMINPVVRGGYAYTLHGVSLAWEDVIKTYPQLGAAPPELD